MSCFSYLDELVKDYLLHRGFILTLKSMDNELKQDKDKGFRVDKIVDQMLIYVNSSELSSLRELWNHFDQKIFCKLELHFAPVIKKLENGLLKLYLVSAFSNNRQDKIMEFFERLSCELQNQPEWKDWLAFPFCKNVEEHPIYSVYFTRQWQDTLIVSLHNVFAISFQCLPLPILANYTEEANKITKLQAENEMLKARLDRLTGEKTDWQVPATEEIFTPVDLMDDFSSIASGSRSENPSRSLKQFFKPWGQSPTNNRKAPSSPSLGCVDDRNDSTF